MAAVVNCPIFAIYSFPALPFDRSYPETAPEACPDRLQPAICATFAAKTQSCAPIMMILAFCKIVAVNIENNLRPAC